MIDVDLVLFYPNGRLRPDWVARFDQWVVGFLRYQAEPTLQGRRCWRGMDPRLLMLDGEGL